MSIALLALIPLVLYGSHCAGKYYRSKKEMKKAWSLWTNGFAVEVYTNCYTTNIETFRYFQLDWMAKPQGPIDKEIL